ncbi:MAG: histidine phosphatase family protein [Deinococcales bacterium]
MTEVVLVRHAPSRKEADRPAAEWQLETGAGARIRALADRLEALELDRVVASMEPKAVATGRGLAHHLRLPFTSAPRLHEHERGSLPLLDESTWNDTLRRFFRHPDVLVFGRETATEARERFQAGLETALRRNPGQRPAVVAHGTVMTLLVAKPSGLDPFELWSSLQMPEAWLVRWPEMTLERRIQTA